MAAARPGARARSRDSNRSANRRPWAGRAKTGVRTSLVGLLLRLLLLTTALHRALAFIVEASLCRRIERRRVELALLLAQHVRDRIANDVVGHHDRALGQFQAP